MEPGIAPDRPPARPQFPFVPSIARRAVAPSSPSSPSWKECLMNLHLTGHHLDITPSIREYVIAKLGRINRHFDHVIDVSVVLSVDKLRQKVEATVHVRGRDLHAESVDADDRYALELDLALPAFPHLGEHRPRD